jgi:hypothetical protein
MPHTSCLLVTLCTLAAAAQDAGPPQFQARELFYSAAADQTPAPKEAPKAALAKKTAKTSAPPKQSAPPAQTAAATPAPQHTQPAALPGGAMLTQASSAPAPASGKPLGLRYTVLKKTGSDMVEVPPDTVFHAGDGIQLRVETNDTGYLYIISQGSSGTWKPVFPSPEVEDGNNHVDGWSAYTLPPRYLLTFDEQVGMENIFLVFSRAPETSLEELIYAIRRGGKTQPEEKAAPKQMVEIARVHIDDATVGRLRAVYARDLIIEKVDEKTPGEKKENAVYVVNPSGGADSRVVADLQLVHQ